MLLRLLLAWMHLLALGVGLGAVWARADALARLGRGGSLRRVFTTDTWWIAALSVWLLSGLVRVLAGLEKPAAYYAYNPLFWTKMGVFAVVFIAELWPMTTILQWGLWTRRGRVLDFSPALRLATLSRAQAVLVVLAAGLAAAMARGLGF